LSVSKKMLSEASRIGKKRPKILALSIAIIFIAALEDAHLPFKYHNSFEILHTLLVPIELPRYLQPDFQSKTSSKNGSKCIRSWKPSPPPSYPLPNAGNRLARRGYSLLRLRRFRSRRCSPHSDPVRKICRRNSRCSIL